MPALTVFSEGLTVIGHRHNHRVIVQTPGPKFVEEFANHGVLIRDLTIVKLGSIAALERLRRFVRRVWIEQMDPNEEGASTMPVQPCDSMRHNLVPTPLQGLIAILPPTPAAKTGIVRAKSAVKSVTPPARIQDHGTHKRRGRVAVL